MVGDVLEAVQVCQGLVVVLISEVGGAVLISLHHLLKLPMELISEFQEFWQRVLETLFHFIQFLD